jgi:hypothetical protein
MLLQWNNCIQNAEWVTAAVGAGVRLFWWRFAGVSLLRVSQVKPADGQMFIPLSFQYKYYHMQLRFQQSLKQAVYLAINLFRRDAGPRAGRMRPRKRHSEEVHHHHHHHHHHQMLLRWSHRRGWGPCNDVKSEVSKNVADLTNQPVARD